MTLTLADPGLPHPSSKLEQRKQWIWDFSAAAQAIIILLMLGAALVLTRMNLRAGRADRRGAARVALYFLFASAISGILAAHWPHELSRFWAVFSKVAGDVTFGAGFVWVSYLALDPFARRYWPDLLISWNRLLAGRVRDPLVGRDNLVGVAVACVQAWLWYGFLTLTLWVRMPGVRPANGFANQFSGSASPSLGCGYLSSIHGRYSGVSDHFDSCSGKAGFAQQTARIAGRMDRDDLS